MSNESQYDRNIRKACDSLEKANLCLETGSEEFSKQFANHAHNCAVVARMYAVEATEIWMADAATKEAAELLKPAYMRA